MNNNTGTFFNKVSNINDARDDEIDLAELLRTLWRGKFKIVFATLVAILIGGYYAFVLAVPIYSASTAVALENRQAQIVDITDVISGLPSDQVSINTEVEVLKSRRLIEKLVLDMNLIADPEFNRTLRPEPLLSLTTIADMVRSLAGTQTETVPDTPESIQDGVIDEVLDVLSITNLRQSYVFVITARTENPVKSAQITDRLAELYIQDQIIIKFEKTEEATEWLSERVSVLQVELETAETALEEFSRSTDLISPEGLMALNRQLKDLRTRQNDLRAEIAETSLRIADLEAARSTNDLTAMTETARDPALSRLLGQGGNNDALFLLRYDQLIDQTRQQNTRAQDQLVAITTSIQQLTRNIDTQASELVELQQYQREAEASRLIYEYFLARLKETSVQQGIQQAESRILSYAVIPQRPSAPRKPIVLILSTILGVMAGAAMVLWREYTQNTFRLAAELEQKTGYPVLGQVPAIASRRRKKVLKYLQDKPNSAAAEAIRNLRTSLLLSNLDNPPKVIMSTSSIPGEGKTTQSIALAQNLAGLGKKILLLEGDIRRRVFSDYFQIEEKPSFLKVLLEDVSLDDAVTHMPEFGIDVLMGEKSTSNAADIFSSDRFVQFLGKLRDRYDYVIIDTPPVLAVTDARIIARAVDAIIYTVKWDSTSHRQVLDGLRSLEQVNVRVSGLVLGQIHGRGMKRYGYGDSSESYQAYYDH
ncbi:GumC family protein [Yoonia sp. 2307UL14-13]|uniref:GumC family protein n=1 Tax=Yoonia sp. 2307UL14-13 TaxID=3126506 RepID=UPI00309C8DF8